MLLVQALYSLHFGHDEDGMDQLLMRVDSNSDGTAFGRAFAHACTHLRVQKHTHTHNMRVCARAHLSIYLSIYLCTHTHTIAGDIDFDEFRLIVYEECVRILQMLPSP